MPITKLTPETAYPYEENRLSALQQVVPEAFTDGKIDWEILREVLGETLEDEDAHEEHFGLSWPGKREARKLAAQPSKGTLVPCPGEGINEEDTENIFIEGDNLEVLKILLKSYAGKIKMVFIDPPYNTGNDFIYNDDFADPLEAYLEYTGAKGEGGELLTTNTRADGRFHSKWLNMMYPRLILTRQLLRDDGVIFISIDENEGYNLREILNELFGEENFVGNFIWQSRTSISNDRPISPNHNHILSYAKNINELIFNGHPLDSDDYKNPDNDPRGKWKLVPLDANKPGGNTNYPILNPNTGEEYYPPNGRSWAINPEEYNKLLNDGRIAFGIRGDSAPKKKLFLTERIEKGDTKTPSSLLLDFGTTKDGTEEIMELFEGKKVFSYPKPTTLMQALVQFGTDLNSIILDFFAGSCTIAQAVMMQNQVDEGRRSFIVIQFPEMVDESREEGKNAITFGLSTIADIGKERIRRAIKRIQKNGEEDHREIPLFSKPKKDSGLGFSAYKLTQANLLSWEHTEITDVQQIELTFNQQVDLSNQNITNHNVLYEILLVEGFPLTCEIFYLEELTNNEVYRIRDLEFCDHNLFVCLDEDIKGETISQLPMDPKHDIFVCRDSALSDEVKARLIDQYTVHVV